LDIFGSIDPQIESVVLLDTLDTLFLFERPENMPGDEKLRKDHEESDSEEEEELEVVPQIDIDVTKLSALSPEVISKQVRANRIRICSLILRGISRLP
jgi:hypothetical protein